MPRRAIDEKLFVKFESRAILNEARSYGAKILDNENKVHEEIVSEGRLVHDNVDYVHIEIPGDRDNVVERPAMCCDKKLLVPKAELYPHCRARKGLDDKPMIEECDVHRFYDEYVAFRAGKSDQGNGTSLRGWAMIDRASVEDLAYYRVYSVEALAGLNDSLAERFLALREKAREWLAQTKKGDPEKDAQIKALQERLAALEAAAGKPAPKGRPGRKPKIVQPEESGAEERP